MIEDRHVEDLRRIVEELGVSTTIELLATLIHHQATDWADELHDLATLGPLIKPRAETR